MSPDKYRPITLLPIIYKIYERLILNMIQHSGIESKIHKLQGGFRSKRGVLEQLGTLRMLMEYHKIKNQPVFAICMDIKKAYDTVWRNAIISKLFYEFSVPIPVIAIIKNMLECTSSGLRDDYYLSHIFTTSNGVVQGGVLSPFLYGVFINDLIIQLDNSSLGIVFFEFHIPVLVYCDDIILLATSVSSLLKLLKICEVHSIKWRYKFNPDKCNIIVYNYVEPMQNIFTTKLPLRDIEVQREFIDQCPESTSNLSMVSAPVAIESVTDNLHYCRGYNINGCKSYWSLNVFNKKLHIHILNYFNDIHNKNHLFLIHWEALHRYHPNMIYFLRKNTFIYQIKIKYTMQCRYLGAYLFSKGVKSLISDVITNQQFIKKLYTKQHQLLHQLELNYSNLHLDIKIPLIRTFFLAYSEIFGQILPISNTTQLDEISIKSQITLTHIYPSRVKHKQFRIFIGMPSPSQRWIMLKLLYYYKSVNFPNLSILHQCVNKHLHIQIPMFCHLRKIINRWIPNLTKMYMRSSECSLNVFKALIIHKINKHNNSQLPLYHPFKIMKFIPNKFKAFYTTNIDRINKWYPEIKQRHLNVYYEIFYNFGWLQTKSKCSNKCNLCGQIIRFKPLSHIIAYCNETEFIRDTHFKKVHNILVPIINIPGNTSIEVLYKNIKDYRKYSIILHGVNKGNIWC